MTYTNITVEQRYANGLPYLHVYQNKMLIFRIVYYQFKSMSMRTILTRHISYLLS